MLMSDLHLYLWDVAVAAGTIGFGAMGLRLLRVRRTSLGVAGVFGVSLWIALGAYLNLLHLLRPRVFLALVAIGVLLLAVEVFSRRRAAVAPDPQVAPQAPFSFTARLLLLAAVAVIGTLMVGGMKQLCWVNDDFQGYAPMAVKAIQQHSIQPDPYCERRVQSGIGGGNFLVTAMLAEGDLRAMPFMDSTFGLFLYAMCLWSVGRRWKIPPAGTALALLCLPVASLMTINLTVVYLAAAAFLAVLLLLSEAPPEGAIFVGPAVACGVIVGSISATKSLNLIFLVLFVPLAALLRKRFDRGPRPWLPALLSLLVAGTVALPWAIANKPVAGTYFYPLLGKGFHVTAYGLVPGASKLSFWPHLFVEIFPNMVLLSVGTVVAWRLTRAWGREARAAALAFFLTALVAVPAATYGLGGDAVDRYTAPYVMPAFLLLLLIVWGARGQRPWRRAGTLVLGIAGVYLVAVGCQLDRYHETFTVAYAAFGKLRPEPPWIVPFNQGQIQKDTAYDASIQAHIPTGAVVLSTTRLLQYAFDFRRNTIYIGDWLGMASPPPGLPLNGGPAEQRQFFVDHGIDYVVADADSGTACTWQNWEDSFGLYRQRLRWQHFLAHPVTMHNYRPWVQVEVAIACHENKVMAEIVRQSPQVFNDGNIVVARLR